MKNLADTQSKARKPVIIFEFIEQDDDRSYYFQIEVLLNDKFKVWKEKKDADNKYRQRQFENCKDIESLYLKMDEIPKTTKNSVKEVSKVSRIDSNKSTKNSSLQTLTTSSALSSKQMFTVRLFSRYTSLAFFFSNQKRNKSHNRICLLLQLD